LQYKFPYPIEQVEEINTQEPFEMSFTTSRATNQTSRRVSGVQNPEEDTLMLTGDLGVARVEWQVQYKKSDPVAYYFNVPEREHRQLIRDTTLATMRRVIGDKFVSRVITVARGEIRRNVESELQNVMDQYNTGITIEGIEIQSTEPPVQQVIDAFKEVDSARQDRETLRNEALRQKEQILNETEGEAQKRISEAKGEAAQIRNQAKGEAERFDYIVEQFEAAPKITRTRMFLETMQDVMKESNRVYIVDDQIKGLLPHLQLREETK
jgi:membrane protease subunit HflK